jgi:hypothetical protein
MFDAMTSRELQRRRSDPVPNSGGVVTLAMAVSIGWGLFLLELVVLGWLVAKHNR